MPVCTGIYRSPTADRQLSSFSKRLDPTKPNNMPKEHHIAHHLSEFQVVILAGGTGHRMYPLTDEVPKALLPVCNRPLLNYQIELLDKAGFVGKISWL